jgi:hypothetical protein
MEKSYKFIHITEISSKLKTKVYGVYNNTSGVCLGMIDWYGLWRQYSFTPFSQMVFSAGCLADIMDFLKNEAGKEQGNESL